VIWAGFVSDDVSLLVMALGRVGALHLHPELRGATVDDLGGIESDPTWDRDSGVPGRAHPALRPYPSAHRGVARRRAATRTTTTAQPGEV
jgi:hypothetical protein